MLLIPHGRAASLSSLITVTVLDCTLQVRHDKSR
jgi:hypothetical protein